MCVPFHIVNIFDDFDDQVDVFNKLFLDTLSELTPIKRLKIKSRSNPFITPEIRQLMKIRSSWQKEARETNDKLHRNAFGFFWQEVKRSSQTSNPAILMTLKTPVLYPSYR